MASGAVTASGLQLGQTVPRAGCMPAPQPLSMPASAAAETCGSRLRSPRAGPTSGAIRVWHTDLLERSPSSAARGASRASSDLPSMFQSLSETACSQTRRSGGVTSVYSTRWIVGLVTHPHLIEPQTTRFHIKPGGSTVSTFGPYQRDSNSGSVHVRHTSARGASKVRSRTYVGSSLIRAAPSVFALSFNSTSRSSS